VTPANSISKISPRSSKAWPAAIVGKFVTADRVADPFAEVFDSAEDALVGLACDDCEQRSRIATMRLKS